MSRASLLVTAGLCLSSSLALAHGGATGIVRERMDQMVTLKDTMKALKEILSKGEAFDSDLALISARLIVEHSGDALVSKFPEGSLSKHSEALPSVWNEAERFAALAGEMGTHAERLILSIESGVPNVPPKRRWSGGAADPSDPEHLPPPIEIFGSIADTCRGCHDDYRKD